MLVLAFLGVQMLFLVSCATSSALLVQLLNLTSQIHMKTNQLNFAVSVYQLGVSVCATRVPFRVQLLIFRVAQVIKFSWYLIDMLVQLFLFFLV